MENAHRAGTTCNGTLWDFPVEYTSIGCRPEHTRRQRNSCCSSRLNEDTMKPINFSFLLCFATVPAETMVAQGVTLLDTVYTPQGYQEGPLASTIFIPSPTFSRGIGVILGRY